MTQEQQQAVDLLNYHRTFLGANDPEYRDEYYSDLKDDDSRGSGILLAEAIEIVLRMKGLIVDGQGKDYPKAS